MAINLTFMKVAGNPSPEGGGQWWHAVYGTVECGWTCSMSQLLSEITHQDRKALSSLQDSLLH